MTAEVINILEAAVARDRKKYGFTIVSVESARKEKALKELDAWAEKYKDLGSTFIAEQGQSLLLMSDMMKYDG